MGMSELVVGFLFRCEGRVAREHGFAELFAKVYDSETGEVVSVFPGASGVACVDVVDLFVAWVREAVGGRVCYFVCENMMRDGGLLGAHSRVDVSMLLGRPTVFFETRSFFYGMYASATNTEASYRLAGVPSKVAARKALDMSASDMVERLSKLRPGGRDALDAIVLPWIVFQHEIGQAPWLIEESKDTDE